MKLGAVKAGIIAVPMSLSPGGLDDFGSITPLASFKRA